MMRAGERASHQHRGEKQRGMKRRWAVSRVWQRFRAKGERLRRWMTVKREKRSVGRSVGRTDERERSEREDAYRVGGGKRRVGRRTREKEGKRKRASKRVRDVARGGRSEVSRDDAVVRLQGRRKEEPRREPVPVTGPPAGRRTRHTAPYRPLLSHSLPPPLYALRLSRPVCYLLANLTSLLAIGDSRVRRLQVLQTMSTRVYRRVDNTAGFPAYYVHCSLH